MIDLVWFKSYSFAYFFYNFLIHLDLWILELFFFTFATSSLPCAEDPKHYLPMDYFQVKVCNSSHTLNFYLNFFFYLLFLKIDDFLPGFFQQVGPHMSPDNWIVFTEGYFDVLPKTTAVVISGSFGITNGLQRSKFIVHYQWLQRLKVIVT